MVEEQTAAVAESADPRGWKFLGGGGVTPSPTPNPAPESLVGLKIPDVNYLSIGSDVLNSSDTITLIFNGVIVALQNRGTAEEPDVFGRVVKCTDETEGAYLFDYSADNGNTIILGSVSCEPSRATESMTEVTDAYKEYFQITWIDNLDYYQPTAGIEY